MEKQHGKQRLMPRILSTFLVLLVLLAVPMEQASALPKNWTKIESFINNAIKTKTKIYGKVIKGKIQSYCLAFVNDAFQAGGYKRVTRFGNAYETARWVIPGTLKDYNAPKGAVYVWSAGGSHIAISMGGGNAAGTVRRPKSGDPWPYIELHKLGEVGLDTYTGWGYYNEYGNTNVTRSGKLEEIATISAENLSADGKKAQIQFTFNRGVIYKGFKVKTYLKLAANTDYGAPSTEQVDDEASKVYYPLGKRTDGGTQWTDGRDLLPGREYTYKFVAVFTNKNTKQEFEWVSKEYQFKTKGDNQEPVHPTQPPGPVMPKQLEDIAAVSADQLSEDGKRATISFTFHDNAYQDHVQVKIYLKPALSDEYSEPKIENINESFQKAFYPLGKRTDGGTQWTDGHDLLPGQEYIYKFSATIKGTEYLSKEYRFKTKGEGTTAPTPTPVPVLTKQLEDIAAVSADQLSEDGKRATISFTFHDNAYQDHVQVKMYLKPALSVEYSEPKIENINESFQKAFYPLGKRTDGGTQWTDGVDLLPGQEYTYKFSATIKGTEYLSKEYRFKTKGESVPSPTISPEPTEEPVPAITYGDADDDGDVDVFDVLSVIDYLVDGTECPDMVKANAHSDQQVDRQDLMAIIDMILK